MIRLPGKGVRYGELWFDEPLEGPVPDILICRQRPERWPGARCSTFTTLVLDLSAPEDELFSSVKKDVRNEVRRAERDGAQSAFLDEPAAALGAFSDFYDRFAATSGVAPIDRRWLREASATGWLALSWAGVGAEPLVWHSYVLAPGRARLLHSASLHRSEDGAGRARLGRLNRWLHWQDIRELKHREFHLYDLGGVFDSPSSPAELGINRFKDEFGGSRRSEYDCVVALTWKGRGYLALQGVRHRVHARRRP